MERAELKKIILETGCALERSGAVFLFDPKSGETEQAQFAVLTGQAGVSLPDGEGWLCIPTGGTSGGMRFARHDEQTLSAAVRGFCAHYGVDRVNALDVLPAHHVSGLMARIRCLETGGQHVEWSWKQLEAGEWPVLPAKAEGWFLSLVPTQLQRLLTNAEAVKRLREFRVVFIGGGPLWSELADAAAAARVPVATCYGMTETAAMVVAQKPEEFLAGDRTCGQVMPHARVEIVAETGLVRIAGENVFRGYWPEAELRRVFLTEDLGQLDAEGRLTILGRRDAVIITGGKKVSPGEVEAALRQGGEFDDVAVLGMPDAEWGSVVVACFPTRAQNLDTGKIEKSLSALASYKRPKRYVTVSPWPRNAQGKLNRAALLAAVLRQPA